MAYTVFTSKDMTAAFNAIAGTGLTAVEIAEDGTPLPERLDSTKAGDSTYQFTTDPLGGKGKAKTQIRITCQASAVEATDNGWIDLGGTTQSLVFTPQPGAGNSKCTLATAYLSTIETTIPVRAYATRVYTFEANANPVWATL